MKLTLLLALLAFATFSEPTASAAQKRAATTDASETCDRFETKIQKLLAEKDVLESVRQLADYELAILALYPPQTYQRGLLQNPAHHLTFRNAFDTWKEMPKESVKIPIWITVSGYEGIISLKGPTEDRKFIVACLDTGRIQRRMGAMENARDILTDAQLTQGARMIVTSFGTIKTQQFKNFVGGRTLVADVRGQNGAPITIAVVGANGVIYAFLLTTTEEDRAADEAKLFKTLNTAKFNFKPADTEKIESIRKTKSSDRSIDACFRTTRELAAIGEFGAAVDELSRLRVLIAEQMPKPELDGNTAKYPLYGMTLRNPDPEKWRLIATNQASLGMLILEDRFSINSSAIMILVLNTVLTYGPQFVESVVNGANEDVKKTVLLGAGRGGIGRIATKIESETFRNFRGMFAYQGIGPANNPKSKVKGIITANADYLLVIVEMADAADFENKIIEYDRILDKNFDLKKNK